jgi:hypothetical protein
VIALVLTLFIGAGPPCEHAGLTSLEPEQQENACRLLNETAPVAGLDRNELTAIYERRGFEHARQRNTGAFQAFLAQLRVWFESLFESTVAETYSNVTRVLVLAVALSVGAIVTLRFLGRRRRKTLEQASQLPKATALVLDDPLVHQQRATSLVGTDPRAAIRESLLGLLSALERARYARPDRVKTNRELAAELTTRGAPAKLVEVVAPLLSWFDRAFYSLEPISTEEARQFLDDVTRASAESAS